MQAIIFYITLPFIYLVSFLPLKILYFISDIIHYLNFYLVKYRRNVVQNNLKNSFPTKTISELFKIEKAFFRILTDYIIEGLKAFTISKKEILSKGTIIENAELNAYAKEGKNIIISVGHVGNQEFVCLYLSANQYFPFTLKAAYHPLTNPYFDKFFQKSRQRFGAEMYTMKETFKAAEQQELNRPFSLFLINDQSAPPKRSYWTQFLNQDTCFYKGMAVFAKKYNMPIFFMHLDRPRRGEFILSFKKITDNPKEMNEAEIIEKHVRLLENNILADPKIWLWSHKRWKHKRPK